MMKANDGSGNVPERDDWDWGLFVKGFLLFLIVVTVVYVELDMNAESSRAWDFCSNRSDYVFPAPDQFPHAYALNCSALDPSGVIEWNLSAIH